MTFNRLHSYLADDSPIVARFLVDIKNTAKLSTGQKAVIGVAGVTTFPVIGP